MEKPLLFLLTLLLHFSVNVNAQLPNTWSIDSTQGVLSYENDAIYFKRPGGILKADYQGNEIWSRTIPFDIDHISIDGNSIYCMDDSIVYRLDTSGSILWARKFATTVCPGLTLPNTLASITGNGNGVYIFIYQIDPGFDRHRSLVVLDSSGTITNSWCDINLQSGIHYPWSSIKSQKSGAWLIQGYSTGPHIGCNMIKMDSLGNIDSTTKVVGGYQGNTATLGKIIALYDSSYFTFNNFYFDFIGQSVVCTKFDEQGNVIWKSTIESTGQIQGLGYMTEIFSATSDDSSNIYLSGWSVDNSDTSRGIIIKLNSAGNLVFTKAWLSPQNSVTDLFYHNGFIFSQGGSKIFDTSFYSPCYAPDTVIGVIYSGPSAQTGGFTASFPIINYSLLNISIPPLNPIPISLRNDLCIHNGIVNKKFNHSISIFPNPATEVVHIDIKDSSKNKFYLEIFNQIGELIYSDELSYKSISVDCRNFQQGIYFVKIQCSEWSTVEKLIVK